MKCLYKYQGGELSLEFVETTDSTKDVYVKDYVDKWNKTPRIFFNDTFKFFIVYHSMRDLYSGNDYDFGQKDLFYIEKDGNKTNKTLWPVIHLTLFDIFDPPVGSHVIPDVKRYKEVIDSSIWNYYVPIFGTDTHDGINTLIEQIRYKDFNRALEEIARNTQNGLYNLQVSREYADINARLVEQSYLNGSHEAISPFLFHSENEMRKKIDEYKNTQNHMENGDYNKGNHKGINQTIWQYRWRFLLLDDKCIEWLTRKDEKQPPCINKLQIIANNLHYVLGFDKHKIWFRIFDFDTIRANHCGRIIDNEGIKIEDGEGEKKVLKVKNCGRVVNGDFKHAHELPDSPNDIQIVIDCVEKVDEAEYCLQTYKYGIVLLDYLLKDEYGYQLLEHLQEWSRNKEKREKKIKSDDKLDDIYKPGPNKRFFFMFISAFTTAVHERMLEKGFGRRERRLWIIGDGACPTNTPYLFSYQLMQLMRHRINDLRKGNEGGYVTLIELLKEIFVGEENNGHEDIRQKAHDHFNKLLFMRNKYHQLENDLSKEDENDVKGGEYVLNMKSSLLVQSAFKYVHHFSGSMFEHLQHMVYLIAFGTIRQWTEMWEEYVFVHKILVQYDELSKDPEKPGMRIVQAMRKYIIDLKENSDL